MSFLVFVSVFHVLRSDFLEKFEGCRVQESSLQPKPQRSLTRTGTNLFWLVLSGIFHCIEEQAPALKPDQALLEPYTANPRP